MYSMEELMPSVGTSVPSPSILSVVLCQSDTTLQNIGKNYSDMPSSPYLHEDFDNPFDFCDGSQIISKIHLISISDDGKIWDWLLTVEGIADTQKDDKKLGLVNDDTIVSFAGGRELNVARPLEHLNESRSRPPSSTFNHEEISIKVSMYLQTCFDLYPLY